MSLEDVASSLSEDYEITYRVSDECTQKFSYKSFLIVLEIIYNNSKQIFKNWAELADVAFDSNSNSMSVGVHTISEPTLWEWTLFQKKYNMMSSLSFSFKNGVLDQFHQNLIFHLYWH